MSAPTAPPPLAGMTVLDLTQQLPGPYATLLLAGLGARVIKIEPPRGDLGREIDPAMFENVNAGKLSVVLDLKRAEGRTALHRLATASDAFVEGFRPGVAERLGAAYEDIAVISPAIVYCSLSGYGATGPYRDVPGHDLNYLGVAGGVDEDAADASGPDHIGIPMIDMASGTMAALAIVAALMRRGREGMGALLDVAMLDSSVFWAAVKPPAAGGTLSEPAYRAVRCADGLALTFAVLEDKFWRNLCRAFAWDDWAQDASLATHAQRRAQAATITARLTATVATRPRAEWLDVLGEADVPVAPVHAFAEVADDPQVRTRGLFAADGGTLRAPLPPALAPHGNAPAPALGADTDAVLAGVGLGP